MTTNKPRPVYSEHDAARVLGVSIDQLRSLVKQHIVKDDEVPAGTAATYLESELVVLKILTRMAANSTAA
jgi:hypothetical protein